MDEFFLNETQNENNRQFNQLNSLYDIKIFQWKMSQD